MRSVREDHVEPRSQVRSLQIPDIKLVTLSRAFDERGFFSETYNRNRFHLLGVEQDFVQDNYSFSASRGVVRGLHFQAHPHAQGKLVRVARGAIFDVVLDIRSGSPTYGQHLSVILSADDWVQLWIPVGFAHGFCALETNTEIVYKTTEYYVPECNRGIRWDDPALGIAWPVPAEAAILSEADRCNPLLAELPDAFAFSP